MLIGIRIHGTLIKNQKINASKKNPGGINQRICSCVSKRKNIRAWQAGVSAVPILCCPGNFFCFSWCFSPNSHGVDLDDEWWRIFFKYHMWYEKSARETRWLMIDGSVSVSGKKQTLNLLLVGGWFTPLKNMSSSIGMMTLPNINGKIQKMATKPPTSYCDGRGCPLEIRGAVEKCHAVSTVSGKKGLGWGTIYTYLRGNTKGQLWLTSSPNIISQHYHKS